MFVGFALLTRMGAGEENGLVSYRSVANSGANSLSYAVLTQIYVCFREDTRRGKAQVGWQI